MKTIPIFPGADACDESSGEVQKVNKPLTRRSFLKGSAVLMGTIAASSVLYALAPSPVWAAPLQLLSEEEGTTIMHMGRVLYPHDKLPDAVYALLAKDLDADASADAAVAAQLRAGVQELNRMAGGKFTEASADKKLEIVTAIEGSPFFNTVRAKCVTSIYDNDMAYAVFGYPGASFDKGGYITRGFQDLDWLPAPPAEASPPSYLG
jgi:hypothetical protein